MKNLLIFFATFFFFSFSAIGQIECDRVLEDFPTPLSAADREALIDHAVVEARFLEKSFSTENQSLCIEVLIPEVKRLRSLNISDPALDSLYSSFSSFSAKDLADAREGLKLKLKGDSLQLVGIALKARKDSLKAALKDAIVSRKHQEAILAASKAELVEKQAISDLQDAVIAFQDKAIAHGKKHGLSQDCKKLALQASSSTSHTELAKIRKCMINFYFKKVNSNLRNCSHGSRLIKKDSRCIPLIIATFSKQSCRKNRAKLLETRVFDSVQRRMSCFRIRCRALLRFGAMPKMKKEARRHCKQYTFSKLYCIGYMDPSLRLPNKHSL